MAIFLAQPKWASTRFKSWVANAIFMTSSFLSYASVQRGRGTFGRSSGAVDPPRIGVGLVIFLVVGDDEIGDVEDQIAGAAVTHQELVAGAKPIEHRKAGAVERNLQPLRGLAAVRMRDQKIAAALLREVLQILQIADQDLLGLYALQHRGLRRRDRDRHLGADLVQHARQVEQ